MAVLHSSRVFNTTFAKVPYRGQFQFPGVAGTFVKINDTQYGAAIAASTSEMRIIRGIVPSYTGKVQWWTGQVLQHRTVESGKLGKTPVILLNPNVVVTEADTHSW